MMRAPITLPLRAKEGKGQNKGTGEKGKAQNKGTGGQAKGEGQGGHGEKGTAGKGLRMTGEEIDDPEHAAAVVAATAA
eukprot:2988657-Heterocapsa_arctica.AAC.1